MLKYRGTFLHARLSLFLIHVLLKKVNNLLLTPMVPNGEKGKSSPRGSGLPLSVS